MSIFSRIAAGEIPSYKVAADDRHFAFLDINPMAPGHTLVIPRREVDYLWAFAREVALKLKKAVPCKRVGVAVLGMEVPHAHIHLVPLQSESDMDFRAPKLSLPAEEMERIASAIASA